jgi:hypothetical protein
MGRWHHRDIPAQKLDRDEFELCLSHACLTNALERKCSAAPWTTHWTLSSELNFRSFRFSWDSAEQMGRGAFPTITFTTKALLSCRNQA